MRTIRPRSVLLVLCAPLVAPDGRAADASPISVQFRLAPETVVVGEPVVLHTCITNRLSETVEVDLGSDRSGWMKPVLVRDADRKPVGHRRYRVPPEEGGVRPDDRQIIAPGQVLEGDWVVSRHYALASEGSYLLTVSGSIACVLKSGETTRAPVVSRPFRFAVRAAKGELAGMADDLAKEIGAPSCPQARRMALLDALFTMPPGNAETAWRAVVNPTRVSTWGERLCREQAIRLLQLEDSMVSVRILKDTWATTGQDAETRRLAQNGLLHLYGSKDPAIRADIRAFFQARLGVSFESLRPSLISD